MAVLFCTYAAKSATRASSIRARSGSIARIIGNRVHRVGRVHRLYFSPGMFGFGRLASYDYFVHLERALSERLLDGGAAEVETYVVDVPPGGQAFIGNVGQWRMRIDADGGYVSTLGETIRIGGRWTAEGDRLVFADQHGDGNCSWPWSRRSMPNTRP